MAVRQRGGSLGDGWPDGVMRDTGWDRASPQINTRVLTETQRVHACNSQRSAPSCLLRSIVTCESFLSLPQFSNACAFTHIYKCFYLSPRVRARWARRWYGA